MTITAPAITVAKRAAAIQTLQAAGRNALVVGGSGFYIQALVSGLFAPPVTDAAVKEKWRQAVRDQGAAAVFDYLRKVDPVSAGRLHVNDTQRIVRRAGSVRPDGRTHLEFSHHDGNDSRLFAGVYRPGPSTACTLSAHRNAGG